MRLDIGPDGRVGGCTVLRSSGSGALDNATCRIMRSRARFVPAQGSGGQTVSSTWTHSQSWRLPG